MNVVNTRIKVVQKIITKETNEPSTLDFFVPNKCMS